MVLAPRCKFKPSVILKVCAMAFIFIFPLTQLTSQKLLFKVKPLKSSKEVMN